jgi:hypothetical protein
VLYTVSLFEEDLIMNAFAQPPDGVKFEDCDFYHTVEIPGRGVVHGQWDLRKHVDDYLGGYCFVGKRVLEIGPASGFLTFEMERRGADVVASKVPDEPGWILFHSLMMCFNQSSLRVVSI